MERAIELKQCLGPMLPGADFDDPEAVAARFALLCDGGAAPSRFHGVELPRVSRESGVPGQIGKRDAAGASRGAVFQRSLSEAARISGDRCCSTAQIDLALRVAAESPHWPAQTPLSPVRMTQRQGPLVHAARPDADGHGADAATRGRHRDLHVVGRGGWQDGAGDHACGHRASVHCEHIARS